MSHDGGDDDAFVEPPKSVADHRLSLNRSVDANKPVQHLPGGGADGYDSDVIPSRPETLRQMLSEIFLTESSSGNTAKNQRVTAAYSEGCGVDQDGCSDSSTDDDEDELAIPVRMTSIGHLLGEMGSSLRDRRRKSVSADVSREPPPEINLDLPLSSVTNVKYLAQGAMCAVYSAVLDGCQVVVKTPLTTSHHFEIAANDIEVEMVLLSSLRHKNIVSIKGAGRLQDGRRFIVLEYLGGGTLSERIRNAKGGSMPFWQKIDIAVDLCSSLAYLHDVAIPGRIVIHRDLKPDNLAFDDDGNIKVIDFGLGKVIRRKYRVRSSTYQLTGGTGSLRYMAPEVAQHHEYNEKADVYSFSLILWEMLTGTKPFAKLRRDDFHSRVIAKVERPEIPMEWPSALRDTIKSCWHENPEFRYTFREILAILQMLAEEENQKKYLASNSQDKTRVRQKLRESFSFTDGESGDANEGVSSRRLYEDISLTQELLVEHGQHYVPKFRVSSMSFDDDTRKDNK